MMSATPVASSELHSPPELIFPGAPSPSRLRCFFLWLEGSSLGPVVFGLGLLIVFLTCFAEWKVGLPHIATYGQDTFIMFDGGWRVLSGQRPSIDFYSAFGPVSYLLTALGLLLSGKSPVGAVYSTILAGAILGVWTLSLVRKTFPVWASLLSVSFVMFFWLAPYPLGDAYYLTSYAMQYNRLGYVLLSLILVEQFAGKATLSGGFSTGVAAGLTLFLKVNFFAGSALIVAVGYLLLRKNRQHLLALLFGFALSSGAFLFYLGGDCTGMIRDIAMSGLARKGRIRGFGEVVRVITRNLTEIAAVAGAAYASNFLLPRRVASARVRTTWLLAGFAGMVLAVDFILAFSNTQRSGFPLSLVAILLISVQFSVVRLPLRRDSSMAPVLPILTAVLLLPTVVGTINAWAIVVAERSRPPENPPARVSTPILKDLIFDHHADPTGLDHEKNNGELYTSFINEGLTLIQANSASSDRIVCLCFSNPFPYALLRTPAKGGSPFFEYTTNFTEKHLPPAERILGDAEVVMFPKGRSAFGHLDVLLRAAQPELRAHYRIVAESVNWTMFARFR